MLLGVIALALVDSINPSAIAITLYLLSSGRTPAHIAVYITTIFLTYLALGVLMMSGLDALLPSVRSVAGGWLEFIVQGFVGLAMLLYALRASPPVPAAPPVRPATASYTALAVIGVTVTTMELPTAVPYFGAIALLTTADMAAAQWLPLLVLYNVIFVGPPLLLLAAHLAFGRRMDARSAQLQARLQAGARETMLWIFGLVGGALLVTSVIEYVARY